MGRAEDNDVMRRRNSLYEIDDPRNRYIETDPNRAFSPSQFREDGLRRFDRKTFNADAELVANFYDETPRDERIIEFTAERVWREGNRVTSIAARYTTERALEGDERLAADPKDEGFLLWFPLAKITVLEHTGNHYRVAIDKRLYDRWEVEELIPLEPKGRVH